MSVDVNSLSVINSSLAFAPGTKLSTFAYVVSTITPSASSKLIVNDNELKCYNKVVTEVANKI